MYFFIQAVKDKQMRTHISIFFWFLLFSLALFSMGVTAYKESDYQIPWCQEKNGKLEAVLDSGERVDCLTNTHAIEFDFATKYKQGLGQALSYSAQTGKKAGIVLILLNDEHRKYIKRLETAIKAHKLHVDYWIIEAF